MAIPDALPSLPTVTTMSSKFSSTFWNKQSQHFERYPEKKSFNKQAFVWSVFNYIHDFLTRNAQNEHTIQKKPVILPDLSFLEMLLSNQTSPCKRSLQLQSDKLMSPVPSWKKKQTKSAGRNLVKNNWAHQNLIQEFSNISATFLTHVV